MFSQEPCLGVNTKVNFLRRVFRNSMTCFDVWVFRLSSTILMFFASGYVSSTILRESMESELVWVSLTRETISSVTRLHIMALMGMADAYRRTNDTVRSAKLYLKTTDLMGDLKKTA